MADKPITVFIAEDHVIVREGLTILLSEDTRFQIVGQCGDGLEAVEQIKILRPDVAVLNLGLPGLNGLDICRQVRQSVENTAVLIMTMQDGEQFIARAFKYGASGYLLKEHALDLLTGAIRAVACGRLYFDPVISRRILKHIRSDDTGPRMPLAMPEEKLPQLLSELGTENAEGFLRGICEVREKRFLRLLRPVDKWSPEQCQPLPHIAEEHDSPDCRPTQAGV